jgi:hypothetical protein
MFFVNLTGLRLQIDWHGEPPTKVALSSLLAELNEHLASYPGSPAIMNFPEEFDFTVDVETEEKPDVQ